RIQVSPISGGRYADWMGGYKFFPPMAGCPSSNVGCCLQRSGWQPKKYRSGVTGCADNEGRSNIADRGRRMIRFISVSGGLVTLGRLPAGRVESAPGDENAPVCSD
ncbi:MAG: hypothetical protein AAFN70_04300, partial [Planctomycetota bacterium]